MSDMLLLTGQERLVKVSESISTRTDSRGVIESVNAAFIAVSGFTSDEALGKPHNLIRHPDIPRAVYHALWEGIKSGEIFFAVTKNRCKNGDHYWTLGYFKPSFQDGTREIIGYRSTRKGLYDTQLKHRFDELFSEVRKVELSCPRSEQVQAGLMALAKGLKKRGFSDYQAMSRLALSE